LSSPLFEKYVKEKLPREDDRQLFEELIKVYREGGKEALSKHLKTLVSDLEA
jgi:hypothetical protein